MCLQHEVSADTAWLIIHVPSLSRRCLKKMPLAGAGQADLDRAVDLARLERRLRRGGRPAGHRSVGDPEDTAVPGTGQAAVARSPSDSGPDMWLHRSASTCTAPPDRMATTGTSPSIRRTGLPSGRSAAASGTASRARPGAAPPRRDWRRRPGGRRCDRRAARSPRPRPARPAAAHGPAAGRGTSAKPRTGSARRYWPPHARRRRASAAHAALTSRPCPPARPGPPRSGPRATSRRDAFSSRRPVQDARRQPRSDRDLDQHRVQRVPEPDPVQRVAHLARPDQPGRTLATRIRRLSRREFARGEKSAACRTALPAADPTKPAGLNRRTSGKPENQDGKREPGSVCPARRRAAKGA